MREIQNCNLVHIYCNGATAWDAACRVRKARTSLRGSADCLLSKLHGRRRSSTETGWEEAGGRRFNIELDDGKVRIVMGQGLNAEFASGAKC